MSDELPTPNEIFLTVLTGDEELLALVVGDPREDSLMRFENKILKMTGLEVRTALSRFDKEMRRLEREKLLIVQAVRQMKSTILSFEDSPAPPKRRGENQRQF